MLTLARHTLCMVTKRRFYLKEWRQFRDMTQQELADASGLSLGYVSNLERGAKRHNEDVLDALSAALKCEPADLLSRNPFVEPEPIARLWDRIAERDRERARRALEIFVPDAEKLA